MGIDRLVKLKFQDNLEFFQWFVQKFAFYRAQTQQGPTGWCFQHWDRSGSSIVEKRLGSGTDRAFGGHSDLSVAMGFAPPSCERLDRRHCADRVLTNISGSGLTLIFMILFLYLSVS